MIRRVLERRQHAALHVVGVVAQRPQGFFERRVGAVPLAGGLPPGQLALFGVRDGVAEGLVEAPDAAPQVGDPDQVVGRPAVVEAVRPHARHAAPGQLVDFGVGQVVPLVDGDGIDVFVVGAEARGGVEVGDGLVQVVHYLRLPVQERGQDVARQREAEAVAVAVVVVRHVMAPVGQTRPHFAVGRPVLVHVHDAVAAVRLGGGGEDEDHVFADGPDHGRILDGQTVGQLHHHFGAARLGRMQPGGDVINGLGARDDRPRLFVGKGTRVGQAIKVLTVGVQVRHCGFVGDDHFDHLASLLRLPYRADFHAGRGGGQRAEVAVDLARIVQNPRRADDRPEMVERRGHRLRRRQVVHHLVQKARVGGVCADFLAVGFVVRLGRGALHEE